jgi:hypothetical protein
MKRATFWIALVFLASIVIAGCSGVPTRRLLDLSTPTAPPDTAPTQPALTNVGPTNTPAPTDVPASPSPVPPTSTVVPAPSNKPQTVTSPTTATVPPVVQQAIKDVINKANDQQVQAFTKHDPSPMQSTATSDYYAKLQQINSDLENGGVAGIKLLKVEWGPISLQGATSAQATTFETWQTNYTDGSTDQSRDRNVYTLVSNNGAWKISDDVHPDSGIDTPSPATIPGVLPGVPGSSPQPPTGTLPPVGPGESRNWSGYAATGGKFTSVTGTWTVPNPSAGSVTATAATWVGIGGAQSHDLIQAGTEETVPTTGSVRYSAWIEMLPQASHRVSLRVNPGDSVTVTIAQQSAGTWLITMLNNTTGQKYESTQQYNSSLTSAEWVEEAPSGGRRVLPLENFGTIAFSASSAVKDSKPLSLSQLGAKAISMIDGRGQTIATPSALANDGKSFSITRGNATAPTLPRFGEIFSLAG